MYDEEQGKKFSIYHVKYLRLEIGKLLTHPRSRFWSWWGESQQMDGRLCLCPFISGHGRVGSTMVSCAWVRYCLELNNTFGVSFHPSFSGADPGGGPGGPGPP